MAGAQGLAQFIEGLGTITRSVVRHHPLDLDAEALVPGNGGFQESHGAFLSLTLEDLAEGETGMIVDRDVDKLPADAPGVALTVAVSGDTVAHTVEFTQFFDIDMDHLAGPLPLIADHRLGGFQIPPAVEAMAHQNATDGGAGEAGLVCNTIIGAPLPTQCNDLGLDSLRRPVRTALGPG